MNDTNISEQIKQSLFYNKETGEFFWRERPLEHFCSEKAFKIFNTKYAGRKAGYVNNMGYVCIFIFKKKYLAHRIAWLLHYGEWPKHEIDHINGSKSDNRIINLRDVSHKINSRNTKLPSHNTSGSIGVHWHKVARKWMSSITVDGKAIYLGLFSEKSLAVAARAKYEKEHLFHFNHGKV